MFKKNFNIKSATLALSLFACVGSSEIFAFQHHQRHQESKVEPAQANYQSDIPFSPVANQPISFSTMNFRTNVAVNSGNSVFEVEVPGLYSIDSFFLLNIPTVGDSVEGFITINGRQLLTFYSRETRTASPVVNFHFNDRLVYLNRGDQISVVLSTFTPGTIILASGFVMVALNNSRSSCSY